MNSEYYLQEHEIPRYLPRFKGLDNIHFNTTRIDGPQRPFRCAISEREPGKSTALWLKFYKENYVNNTTVIVLRRLQKDVSAIYIDDIGKLLNKFTVVPVLLDYNKGSAKDGIVDVYISEIEPNADSTDKNTAKYNRRLFFRVVGLSNELTRLKSMLMPNLKYLLFDEFICNERHGEKYLREETFQFKELYNTFNRETKNGIISYFIGNPYSVYNPYFSWWGVDTRRIRPGAYFSNKACTIECYEMKQELRDMILKKNPLYEFDDTYKAYAFDGAAINDLDITLINKPIGAQLKYIFKVNNQYFGYYLIPQQDIEYTQDDLVYYCECIKNWKKSYAREAIIFDFNEQSENTNMLIKDASRYYFLKMCIGNGRVGYDKVDSENATEFIYSNL